MIKGHKVRTSLRLLQSQALGVVVAIGVFLYLNMLAGCNVDNNYPNKRSEQQQKKLDAIDHALKTGDDKATPLLRKAMAEAKDSTDYYDFFLRYLRSGVDGGEQAGKQTLYRKAYHFLQSQTSSPRINGMWGYWYNIKGYNNLLYHHTPRETVSYFYMAYRHLLMSDTPRMLPDVCANLADGYLWDNDLPKAAFWYRRALVLADSLKLPTSANASLYMGLARVYQNLEDYPSAFSCFETAGRHFKDMPFNMQTSWLNNFGTYYYTTHNYTKALEKFNRMLQMLIKAGKNNSYDLYLCKLNMADVYLNMGHIRQSCKLISEVTPFFENLRDSTALYYINTIRIGQFLKQGNLSGVQRLLSNENHTPKIDFTLVNIRNRYLQQYYEQTSNYPRAYRLLKAGIAANDSLAHNKSRMRAAEIMMRYTADTLALHHSIAMQAQDTRIVRTERTLIAAIAVAFMAILVALWRTAATKRKIAESRMKITDMRLANMRSKLSPHFIFNVLNNSLTDNKMIDETKLMSIVRLIRANLSLAGRNFISLAEEMDFVQEYIRVVNGTLNGDISLHTTLPPRDVLEQRTIPSMFIQILVENAVKHGLKNKKGEKKLNITITAEQKLTRITVADNGPGFDATKQAANSTRTGLETIRSTMALINWEKRGKMSLHIHNTTNERQHTTGCEATITIALNTQPIINKTK